MYIEAIVQKTASGGDGQLKAVLVVAGYMPKVDAGFARDFVDRPIRVQRSNGLIAERRIRQRQLNEASRGLERINKHINKLETKIGQLAIPQ